MKLYARTNPEAEPFVVHKDFACYHSPVLKAAFNSDFLEGQLQEYRLDISGSAKNVVRILVNWFYTQKLEFQQITRLDGNASTGTMSDEVTQSLLLIKLWILADKLLIPKLQNEVIDALEEGRGLNVVLISGLVRHVCENTARDSPLRRYIVAKYATQLTPGRFYFLEKDIPSEFLCDLVAVYRRGLTPEQRLAFNPRSDMSVYKMPDV